MKGKYYNYSKIQITSEACKGPYTMEGISNQLQHLICQRWCLQAPTMFDWSQRRTPSYMPARSFFLSEYYLVDAYRAGLQEEYAGQVCLFKPKIMREAWHIYKKSHCNGRLRGKCWLRTRVTWLLPMLT